MEKLAFLGCVDVEKVSEVCVDFVELVLDQIKDSVSYYQPVGVGSLDLRGVDEPYRDEKGWVVSW